MGIEVVYVNTVLCDSLDIHFEGALFVGEYRHIVDEIFGADSVDVVEHESESVVRFGGWGFVSLPAVSVFGKCLGFNVLRTNNSRGYVCVSI